MKGLLCLAAATTMACAPNSVNSSRDSRSTTTVGVVSHHRSDVDVYMLCGERDAILLGMAPSGGYQAFEISSERLRCAVGLNFFLVVRDRNRGYWVGPLRPSIGSFIRLVVEKYAGLSNARVRTQ